MSLGNGVADDAASQSKATCEQVAAGPHLAAEFRIFKANSLISSCHIADVNRFCHDTRCDLQTANISCLEQDSISKH